MKKLNAVSWIATAGIIASLAMVAPAFAQTSAGVSVGANAHGAFAGGHGGMRGGMAPGVFGTVSAVNGTTLTVTSKPRPVPMRMASSTSAAAPASIVYTVDASNATIYKGSATTTVSIASVAVGDAVMVQGTVSGTNVAATVIRDGIGGMMGRPGMPVMGGKGFGHGASSTPSTTPIIQGNGQPVVGGSVTAISGTTLTVTNPSNVTYTIDASSATIVKNGTSTAFSNIAVGDNVLVQGTVNGTSVTASSVIDQGVKGTNASSTNGSPAKPNGAGFGFGGIFASIGGFFQHLFGF
ncbi:MAG TPA: DUF5666 domain-containing protein [Candidatus Paceibacterota bacterium]|nr:DUF5666 domain-containing protein [Candidatus Paceibacterota bacterium]